MELREAWSRRIDPRVLVAVTHLSVTVITTIFFKPDSLFPTDLFAFGKSGRENQRLIISIYSLGGLISMIIYQ